MRVWPTFLMVFVLVLLLLPASAARASPYWIAYEGNDFPENEGWLRFTGQGGAQRSLEDGWLVLDGRADPRIYDAYRLEPVGKLTVGPGEEFIAEWRLDVADVLVGTADPAVAVFFDDKRAVAFHFGETTVVSSFETGVGATYSPGVPHEFELRSSDMRTYALVIDGNLAIRGAFWESLTASRVSWGDMAYGASSLARWDYFRFGVVPECSNLVIGNAMLLLVCVFRDRAGR